MSSRDDRIIGLMGIALYMLVQDQSNVSVLLGLSVVVVSHPPPIGPVGLVCFAGAAGLLAISQRTSSARAARAAATTPAIRASA